MYTSDDGTLYDATDHDPRARYPHTWTREEIKDELSRLDNQE
jgi:hypothetical protein